MAGLVLPLLMGAPSLVGGIMSMIESGKRLAKGGRVKRRVVRRKRGGRVKRRIVQRKHGRGIAADIASSLPLIGGLAGPLVRALGGRIQRRAAHGRKIRRGRGHYGMNITPTMMNRLSSAMAKTVKYGHGLPNTHIYEPIAVGSGLLGPGRYRPATYGGLLSPTGGKISYRKGHRRYVGGRMKYIKPTVVHHNLPYRKKLLMY